MAEIMRFLGVAGIVLLTFGLIPYGLTGAFDMWTAVHVTGGAILLACAIGLNFARFRSAVAARGTRQQLQALIGTALFGALLVTTNIVAVRHPWVHDTTAERIHTLSERSRAVAGALEEEVELLAFIGAGAPERAMLRGLLERFAAAGPRVRWRMVDPVQDPDLADRFEIRQEGVLVAVTESGSARQQPDPTFGWTESSVTHLLLRRGGRTKVG